jgi:hypothetical protein
MEAAENLGIPPGTIKSRTFRALDALHKRPDRAGSRFASADREPRSRRTRRHRDEPDMRSQP